MVVEMLVRRVIDGRVKISVELVDTSVSNWSPERLKAWAEERHKGHQYTTKYGVVRCPTREDQWKDYPNA